MRDKIMTIIKNTFELKDSDDVSAITDLSSIEGLNQLLFILANESSSDKELALHLEWTVVKIIMKPKQTALEQEFLTQVAAIIDNPLYQIKE
ncbi:MAG: hypothetical protein EBY16_06170 [Gammaproteobacteria bacterium]|nr:hypothetical protein [Gammaproteobacteria bacterium]